MSEKVFLRVIEVVFRIRVIGAPLNMGWFSSIPIFGLAKKARWDEDARSRTPDYMKGEQSVECHADAYGTSLQPILQSFGHRLEEIPFFGFAGIFCCVCSCMVGASRRVECEDIHTGWTEHRQVKVVRYNKLIVFWQAPLHGNSLCVFAKASVRLIRPGKEEHARRGLSNPSRRATPKHEHTHPLTYSPVENLHVLRSFRQYIGLQAWRYGRRIWIARARSLFFYSKMKFSIHLGLDTYPPSKISFLSTKTSKFS